MTGLPGAESGTVVTVGTFDGVHLGHRRVLEEIALRARRSGSRSLLVTFEPHPLEVINPGEAPPLLTLSDERREVLAQSDLDVMAVLRFTHELSRYSPEQFVRLLRDRFSMSQLVIGYDHGLGRGRTGDVDALRSLGKHLEFEVDVVEAVTVEDRAVSSTVVRKAVADGDLGLAARFLGRRYSFCAEVVHGAGRGRNIGYRTINLKLANPRKLLPPEGVYAVWAEWGNGASGGMMHQGPRPTFGDGERSLEVHLLDAEADLYGEQVKVSWVTRLRDVMRFESPQALKAQLDKDFRAARAALTQ